MATRQQASDEATKQIAALRAEVASLREELDTLKLEAAQGLFLLWNHLYENAPDYAAKHEAYHASKEMQALVMQLENGGEGQG